MEIHEVVASSDTERVVLVLDTDPHEPYDDGGSPILRYWRDRSWGGFHAEQITDITSYRLPYGIEQALAKWGDDESEKFERYCRIYHGATSFEWYDHPEGDHKYVTLDPADWREQMGLTAEHLAAHPDVKTASLEEWRYYVEGDVFGVVTQKLVTWKAEGHPDRQEWEETDSVWGHYGEEWAVQAAKEEWNRLTKGDK